MKSIGIWIFMPTVRVTSKWIHVVIWWGFPSYNWLMLHCAYTTLSLLARGSSDWSHVMVRKVMPQCQRKHKYLLKTLILSRSETAGSCGHSILGEHCALVGHGFPFVEIGLCQYWLHLVFIVTIVMLLMFLLYLSRNDYFVYYLIQGLLWETICYDLRLFNIKGRF